MTTESESGGSNAILGVIIGAIIVIAVALFAFGGIPTQTVDRTIKIETPAPAPAPATPN